MNVELVKNLVCDYYDWLKAETEVLSVPEQNWFAISTPFEGRFNDTIGLYIKKEGDRVYFSDDGETLGNIIACGGNVKSGKIKTIIERTKLAYGIDITDNEIHIEVPNYQALKAKHRFISALIELNDIEIEQGSVKPDFHNEISNYLYYAFPELNYTPFVTIKGETGLEYTYNFQCLVRDKEEIFIKAFNKIGKNLITPFLYSFLKIKNSRPKLNRNLPVRAIAIINDTVDIDSAIINSIKQDGADFIPWSQRKLSVYSNKLCPTN